MKQDNREIRVFISSTFADMREERRHLNTHIFPELRKVCEERGVVFTEVDLQWGINEEDAKQGGAVEICLEEINRCHPYFIGMLGERYGWSPREDKLTVRKDDEPETDQHIRISDGALKPKVARWNEAGESVTAMEIMHGVIENREQHDFSYFYLRDNTFTEKLLKKAEVESAPSTDFKDDDSEKLVKLEELKERIRKKEVRYKDEDGNEHVCEGKWHVRDYGYDQYIEESLENFGMRVRDDLMKAIEERFPEKDGKLSALQKEQNFHAAFAHSRLDAYIPDEIMFKGIAEHFSASAENPTPLVISGEMGSGKSALVANYVKRWREANPKAFVIEHYAGSGGESDADGVLLRVMNEIKEHSKVDENFPEIEDDLPRDSDEIYSKFAEWMLRIPKGTTYLIALDGVNQFRGKDSELHRFICSFPEHGHVIISNLVNDESGKGKEAHDAVIKRGWFVKEVEPLEDPNKRRLLATTYLARFKKEKGLDDLLDKLINHKHGLASNPLFLRVVLDELRMDAHKDILAARLNGYLNAENLVDLFEMLLTRCENTYSKSHVKEVLTLIFAARYGLGEAELLEIMNQGDPERKTLPQRYLSTLVYGLGGYLADREGLYGFMHDALRQAVEKRYALVDKEGSASIELNSARKEIVAYFQKLKGPTQRQADELPWLLVQLDDNKQLQKYLAKLDVFLLYSRRNNGYEEFLRYWIASNISPVKAYEFYFKEITHLPDSDEKGDVYAKLLYYYGFIEHQLTKSITDSYLEFGTRFYNENSLELAHCYELIADAYNSYLIGKVTESIELFKKSLDIKVHILGSKTDPSLATTYQNMANAFYSLPKIDEARKYYQLSIDVSNDDKLKAGALHNWAFLEQMQTQYEYCLTLYDKALAVFRKELGENHFIVASCLSNMGNVFSALENYPESERLHTEALRIRKSQLGVHVETTNSLNNLAVLYEVQGMLSEAEQFYLESLEIRRKFLDESHPILIKGRNLYVAILYKQQKIEKLELFYRHEFEENGVFFDDEEIDRVPQYISVGYKLLQREKLSDVSDAEKLFKRSLGLIISINLKHPQLEDVLNGVANTMYYQGHNQELQLHLAHFKYLEQ